MGGRTSLPRVGDRPRGDELVRGEVLGGLTDKDTDEEADDQAEKVLPPIHTVVAGIVVGNLEKDENCHGSENQGKQGCRVHTHVQGVQEVFLKVLGVHGGRSPHKEETDDGSNDTETSNPEWERCATEVSATHLAIVGFDTVRGQGKGGSCHNGTHVTFEEVGTHASYITNVVTHIVCDGSRVVVGVLGEILLDLADQVSTDIGSLGVDATSDTSEQGDRGCTEGERRQVEQSIIDVLFPRSAVRVPSGIPSLTEEKEEDGEAKQTEAHHSETHDGTTCERDLQSFVETRLGSLGSLDIAFGGHLHAHPTRTSREDGTDDEADHHPPAIWTGLAPAVTRDRAFVCLRSRLYAVTVLCPLLDEEEEANSSAEGGEVEVLFFQE